MRDSAQRRGRDVVLSDGSFGRQFSCKLRLSVYNPFPADPGNPAGPVAAIGGPQLNNIIRQLAIQYNGVYVDTATPFVGREDELTFIDEMPAGSLVGPPFGGVLPIGNAHPNAAGYDVIAGQIESVPEPSSLLLLSASAAVAVYRRRVRRT